MEENLIVILKIVQRVESQNKVKGDVTVIQEIIRFTVDKFVLQWRN